MLFAFQLLARLPLWLLHGLGAALGWLVFCLSPGYRRNFSANAKQAGIAGPQWRAAVAAAGRLTLEVPRLWLGRPVPVRWQGAEQVDTALAQGRGVVFITPHIGCFEVAAQAYAQRFGARHPMTALYRPARQPWLAALEARARARPGLLTAPTTAGGVRQMLRALQAGHCVGLLPDQVPPSGQGVWQPFFGKPAYTMTLSAKLHSMSGAPIILTYAERLPQGKGYVVRFVKFEETLTGDPVQQAEAINRSMEKLIARSPAQYFWSYNRYKIPANVAPPPAQIEH